MKRVLIWSESGDLELLKKILEEGGIHSVIRNPRAVKSPTLQPLDIELWVLNDSDFPRARELCQDWFTLAPDAVDIWVCPKCEQGIESRFEFCWQCGSRQTLTRDNHPEAAAV